MSDMFICVDKVGEPMIRLCSAIRKHALSDLTASQITVLIWVQKSPILSTHVFASIHGAQPLALRIALAKFWQ
jgi:hypothetical protein